MPHKLSNNPADYIVPLNINGLEGRMLHVPAPSTRHNKDILLVYGHHAMLERWWGLVENLNQYGAVTMPDIPGFGGMDSFHKVGIRPTVDTFADYLAAFVKMRYKRKRVTVVAISYGFVIATRMLQKYPELVNKVDLLVSLVGFVHKDDLAFKPRTKFVFKNLARLFATRPFSLYIRYTCLNRFVLTTFYSKLPNSRRRMIEIGSDKFNQAMDFEVKMWQANDVRTHWLTTSEFFTIDNCQKKLDLPVIHVVSTEEHYFNNDIVEQHMKITFSGYKQFKANSKAHTPSVLADKKEMSVMLPAGLRRILAKA